MSEPIIEYRDEFNVMDFASKYAERISRVIDEQTLANVEHQLARYGYVKVVRCRDCKFQTVRWSSFHGENVAYCERFVHLGGFNSSAYVEPDGFCAWAKRSDK